MSDAYIIFVMMKHSFFFTLQSYTYLWFPAVKHDAGAFIVNDILMKG